MSSQAVLSSGVLLFWHKIHKWPCFSENEPENWSFKNDKNYQKNASNVAKNALESLKDESCRSRKNGGLYTQFFSSQHHLNVYKKMLKNSFEKGEIERKLSLV